MDRKFCNRKWRLGDCATSEEKDDIIFIGRLICVNGAVWTSPNGGSGAHGGRRMDAVTRHRRETMASMQFDVSQLRLVI